MHATQIRNKDFKISGSNGGHHIEKNKVLKDYTVAYPLPIVPPVPYP
jgi:hypothetical protein